MAATSGQHKKCVAGLLAPGYHLEDDESPSLRGGDFRASETLLLS